MEPEEGVRKKKRKGLRPRRFKWEPKEIFQPRKSSARRNSKGDRKWEKVSTRTKQREKGGREKKKGRKTSLEAP